MVGAPAGVRAATGQSAVDCGAKAERARLLPWNVGARGQLIGGERRWLGGQLGPWGLGAMHGAAGWETGSRTARLGGGGALRWMGSCEAVGGEIGGTGRRAATRSCDVVTWMGI